MSVIKWDGDKDYQIYQEVSIASKIAFKSLTCLETSFLCFASSTDGLLIRFDIRSFEDPTHLTKTFSLPSIPFDKILITDTNLNYMFTISGNSVNYHDPKTLSIISSININSAHSQTPKFISTFSSNPLVIISSTAHLLYVYDINPANN